MRDMSISIETCKKWNDKRARDFVKKKMKILMGRCGQVFLSASFLSALFSGILTMTKRIQRLEDENMATRIHGVYAGLHIITPEEMKSEYQQVEQEELKEYRLRTLNEFVKSWKVKYFFNHEFKWNLRKLYNILPGLDRLNDHAIGFVDENGYYFLLLQPYENPEKYRKYNKIGKYMRCWHGGFHNPEAYATVISGDFLTYLENHIDDFKNCREWCKWKAMDDDQKFYIDCIVKISDVHRGTK